MIRNILIPAVLLMLLASPTVADDNGAEVTVFRTPWCGCCHAWAEAIGKAGYRVKSVELEDLSPVRRKVGVPSDMLSCHVATVDGYFLEGHVPLTSLRRLLAERPDIAGISVPGMPEGALGMGDDPAARYDVHAVPRDPGVAPFVFDRAGG